jgi:release factor glutamine methyltransferase
MFVQTNSVKSIKEYMKSKLSGRFSDSEIRLICNETIGRRLNCSAEDMICDPALLLSESDLLYCRKVVKRILNDEPFQYIIGNTHFYGLDLLCDARALIPRPETEELVDWVKESLPADFKGKIVDLCTGSGCIALALKSIFPEAAVFATDVSLEAIRLGEENASRSKGSVEFFEFDATEAEAYQVLTDKKGEGYECWVSNPPYIPWKEKSTMSANVLNFEPHMALFVPDEDPLLFYREIAASAIKLLKNKGLLFFEVHEDLAAEVGALLVEIGFYEIEIKKDLQEKTRMVKAEKVQ